MEIKKTGKIGVAYFLGNVFDKAIAFVTIPIFTRLLSTTEYGVTTTYLSWASILTVVLTLCLGNSIRTALVDFPNEEKQYISSIFFIGTLSAIIMTSFIVLFSFIFGFANYLILIVCCCFHSYGASIITAIQWKNMMKLEYIKRTLLQSLPNLAIVGLSILFIILLKDNKYYGRVFAYTIVFGFLGLIFVLVYILRGKCLVNKTYLKYALSFSLPLIVHSLSTVILSQSDRVMITMLYNTAETGIYGLAYQFGMLPLVITTTLENIWIPWFTKKMESNDKESVTKMVDKYVYASGVVCICIMLVSPEFLRWMSTGEYSTAVFMIPPVVLATFFMFLASIAIDYEYYKKKTLFISINTIVAALVNIALNFIFIPKYGGIAAAYTTVFSYFVSFIAHFIFVKVKDKHLFPTLPFIVASVVSIVSTAFVLIMMDYMIVRWVVGFVIGIVFLVLFIIFIRKSKKQLLNQKAESLNGEPDKQNIHYKEDKRF